MIRRLIEQIRALRREFSARADSRQIRLTSARLSFGRHVSSSYQTLRTFGLEKVADSWTRMPRVVILSVSWSIP